MCLYNQFKVFIYMIKRNILNLNNIINNVSILTKRKNINTSRITTLAYYHTLTIFRRNSIQFVLGLAF